MSGAAAARSPSGDASESPPGTPRPDSRFFEFDVLDSFGDEPTGAGGEEATASVAQGGQPDEQGESAGASPEGQDEGQGGGGNRLFDFDDLDELADETGSQAAQSAGQPETSVEDAGAGGARSGAPAEAARLAPPRDAGAAAEASERREEPLSSFAAFHESRGPAGQAAANELADSGPLGAAGPGRLGVAGGVPKPVRVDQQKLPGRGAAREQPVGTLAPGMGDKDCNEPLVLITESSGWDPGNQDLRLTPVWADAFGNVCHEVRLRLASEAEALPGAVSSQPEKGDGAPTYVSCTFQILSVRQGWEWRIYPSHIPAKGKAWGRENLLVPSDSGAVEASLGSEHGHSRYFCIVEPLGTVVSISVLLSKEDGGILQPCVWYECCDAAALGSAPPRFCGCDRALVPSSQANVAIKLRGRGPSKQLGGPAGAPLKTNGSGHLSSKAEANTADPSRWPCGAERPFDGLKECRENLVLVCDVTDWDPTEERTRFTQIWSKKEGTVVRHQLCVKLAGEGSSGQSGLPLAWESAFVSLTFQVLSRDKKWEWRLFPADVPLRGDGKAWGPENVLVPGAPEAVKVMQGKEGAGLVLHGRDFHIVEPYGTVVTICAELSVDPEQDPPREVHARVWYEHFNANLHFTGQDKKPVPKGGVLKAMKYRGLDPAHEWERVIKSRCPMWWRRWDKLEQARHQLSQQARKVFEAERAGKPASAEPSEVAGKTQNGGNLLEPSPKQSAKKAKKKPFTKEEALYHIGSLISHLTTNQKTLEDCRTLSSVKFGLFDTFPYMPPKAMSVMSQMVEEALKKSSSESLHAFLERFDAAAWDSGVQKAFERFTKTIEAGDESASAAGKRDKEALMMLKDKSTLAACGTRLASGTRVQLRWQPNSEGARYLAYLNGHVGTLISFDRNSMRWTIGFETFDGHLQVASEHLHVCNETVAEKDKKAASRKAVAEPECDMCNGRFLESQLLVLGCPHAHMYCHECLRKWVRMQLVPRCYRCLEDNDALILPDGYSGQPWMAVPKSDGAAADDYRVSKKEIDQLDCICAVEVSGGAQCIILGVQGLCGKHCTVGRVEKTRAGSFAAVYLAGGRKLELMISCLEVDDCLSSGRLAKGEICPSKGERFGLGLSVASLGCACPVKQTMNELYIEQFAMPYDWLVSRVEGVIYFFRHGFRDFVHYDDIRKDDTYHGFFHENTRNNNQGMEQDGDHGYCSYRTVYHAFPHHDVSEAHTKNAFVRRCDRLLHLVKGAILEATSRPILLARICARTQELDFSEELYVTLRALGGQKIYLLILLTEQPRNVQGAVQHIRHPNLIFYIAGRGGGELADGLRFGMDYAYQMDNFGLGDVSIARTVSPLSPIGSAAVMRKEMQHHQIWLNRDNRGEPSLTDIGGCFEAGPNQYYPGRYHKGGTFEASPHLSRELQEAVRKGDVKAVEKLGRDGADINAWDANGETLLFPAAQRGDLATCASLILAAADPNCRDRKGRRPVDHVIQAEAAAQEEAKEKEAKEAKAKAKAKARAAAQKGAEGEKKKEGAARSGSEIVPFATALSLMGSKSSAGPDLREQLKHIRFLLLHAGGLDVVREQDVLAAIAAVPEPDRRRLVSRLGICTPPDLLPTKVPVLKLAKSTQVLFTRQMLSEAEAKGEDMVAALLKLRETAGFSLPERRQILRVMLRDWHPDKHQGKPKEEQDHANAVFCYIQGMRNLFLGAEDKEAAGGTGKEQ